MVSTYELQRLCSHRRRLGLSLRDFGRLVGARPHTVYRWEQGDQWPMPKQLRGLKQVRKLGKRLAVRRLGGRLQDAEAAAREEDRIFSAEWDLMLEMLIENKVWLPKPGRYMPRSV